MNRLSSLCLAPLLVLAACSHAADTSDSMSLVTSKADRITTPNVSAADAAELQQGNAAFAVDLYQTLRADSARQGHNLFFSPHSISLALAMTYAGAREQTAIEMAKALHYTLPQERLHPAFDALDLALASRADARSADASDTFKLRVVNSIFGAPETNFLTPFLDTLATNYGAGVRLTDFRTDPERARITINDWVKEQTASKIDELLPKGTIDTATAAVLVNAVYFNAAWATSFEPAQAGTFHGVAGDASAQLMRQVGTHGYAAGDDWQAVSLPYKRGLSMVTVVPRDFRTFESAFSSDVAQKIAGATRDGAGKYEVTVTLPKFKIEGASFDLKEALGALGMKSAFDGGANFLGMSPGPRSLFVSHVQHQAFVAVDEQGTEAAAATAVVIDFQNSAPTQIELEKVRITADHPFIFFIRDDATGAILFLGRVVTL